MQIGLLFPKKCKHVVTLDFIFKVKTQQDSGQHGERDATADAASSFHTESVVIDW